MKKLILVHGTNVQCPKLAAAENPNYEETHQWWHSGSKFRKNLSRFLNVQDDNDHIELFAWHPGQNSEIARRDWGRDLYKQLSLHEKDEQIDGYYLIGHSHGGSVVYNALAHARKNGNKLEKMRLWCTVGTPFIEFDPKWYFFWNYDRFSRGLFFSIVALFVVMVWSIFITATGTYDPISAVPPEERWARFVPSENIMPLTLLLSLCLTLALLFWHINKNFLRTIQKVQYGVKEDFEKRWFGIYHGEDEAINYLKNIGNFQFKVFDRSFLTKPIVILYFMVIAFFVVAPLTWLILHMWPSLYIGSDFLRGNTSRTLFFVMLTAVTMFAIAVIVGGMNVISEWLWQKISEIVGGRIARGIDRFISSQVQALSWGADFSSEGVMRVATYPPGFKDSFRRIDAKHDDRDADDIARIVDDHALNTIKRIRSLLSVNAADLHDREVMRPRETRVDFIAKIERELSWKELIHTAYFHSDDFCDLVISLLEERGLGRRNAREWAQDRRQRALEHLHWLVKEGDKITS